MLRFIRLNELKEVVSIRDAVKIADGEIQSDVGEIGQIMRDDGTFFTPEPIPVEPQATLDEIAEETLLETKYQTLLLEMML